MSLISLQKGDNHEAGNTTMLDQVGMRDCAAARHRPDAGPKFRSSDIPNLEQRNGMTKLIVDGNPFICVAGELANSSSSDVETMKATFPRLAKCNLNTVLSVVSWDLIEPQEGKFDFWMVDYQIEAAKASDLASSSSGWQAGRTACRTMSRHGSRPIRPIPARHEQGR